MKVYQFRLFPTKSQLTSIKKQMEVHRLLYNECLEEKIKKYSEEKISLSDFDLIKCKVKKYKGQSNYSSLQQTIRRLGKSYKRFFSKNSKFPRFKSKNRFNTIEYAKVGDGCKLKIEENLIYIQYVGDIICNFHRKIEGKIKTLSLTLRGNFLYINIFCEQLIQKKAKRSTSIGIDFGITNTITLSNGENFQSPKFTRKKEKDLARLNRRKNYKAITKVYKKIKNKRKDFNHKLSKKIVDDYDIICIENLKVENIKSNISNINKRLYDIGICQLKTFINYKAENAGKLTVLVDPSYTTQKCSQCNDIKKKKIKDREHNCNCGLVLDRDHNASINILRAGLRSLGLNP